MAHILLADDNLNLLEDITHELELSNYTVTQAVNGRDLFDKLRKISALPDLIIVDLVLGDVDSMDLLDCLKKSEWRHIPMIFLCPFNAPDKLLTYVRSQADEHLIKPFQIGQIMHLIAERLADSTPLM
ncbi:MAG: response regulator [Anaerolineae bacterium]